MSGVLLAPTRGRVQNPQLDSH